MLLLQLQHSVHQGKEVSDLIAVEAKYHEPFLIEFYKPTMGKKIETVLRMLKLLQQWKKFILIWRTTVASLPQLNCVDCIVRRLSSNRKNNIVKVAKMVTELSLAANVEDWLWYVFESSNMNWIKYGTKIEKKILDCGWSYFTTWNLFSRVREKTSVKHCYMFDNFNESIPNTLFFW